MLSKWKVSVVYVGCLMWLSCEPQCRDVDKRL